MTCWRFAGPSRPPPSRAQRACSPEAVVSGSWPSAAIVSVRSAMAGVVSTGTSSKSNPLIVGATDPNQPGTRTFGTQSTATPRPFASRIWSTVPCAHVQRDTPDLGAPNSEFLTQRDELDRGICRPRLPRSVQGASGETVTWLQAQAYRAARARRAERIDLIWEGCVNRRHREVPVPA